MSMVCPNCGRIFKYEELFVIVHQTLYMETVKLEGSILCNCGWSIGFSKEFAPTETPPEIRYAVDMDLKYCADNMKDFCKWIKSTLEVCNESHKNQGDENDA